MSWARTGASASATGVHHPYIEPSPLRYPWQWYWDSCFAAIVNRHIDRGARAPSSRRCSPPSGPTASSATRSSGTARGGVAAAVLQRRHSHRRVRRRRSSRRCSPGRGGSRSATRRPSRACAPTPSGWRANRDLDGDGLLWIVQAGRVGARFFAQVRPGVGVPRAARVGLPAASTPQPAARLGRARVRDAGGPVLCEVVVNVLWGLARMAMGEPSITPAMVERLWDERAGCSSTRRSPAACGPAVKTCAGLAPWRCPTCPRRSGAGWSRSTCSTRALLARVRRRRRSRRPSRGSSPAPGAGGAALLARAHLGQRRLAGVDRARPPRLRRAGLAAGGARCAALVDARACASTSTHTPARASAPPTSPGPA